MPVRSGEQLDGQARRIAGETRVYVTRITGRQAEQWTSSEFVRDPEATLMPAKAPCVEVAQAVEAQSKIVRVAKLMAELAAWPRRRRAALRTTTSSTKRRGRARVRTRVAGAARECGSRRFKNISEQKIREAQARTRDKVSGELAREWSRIADRP
jgi:hypothetical protein